MGKRKYIETPERLYELFTQYKQWVNDNPILVEDYVGKDADRVMRQKQRPLTMVGFECFVMDNTDISYPDLTNYFDTKNESFENFIPISTRIRSEIQNNQVSGGMVGIFNPSLTARLNGLKEQTESTTTVKGVSKITIE